MWYGPNPNAMPEFERLRALVARQRQTPTSEWPLIYLEDEDMLLVVRTWPDGSITAYTVDGSTLDDADTR